MIHQERALVMDIDGTLCRVKSAEQSYLDVEPIPEVVDKLREYRQQGFYVILYSSRNMKTYQGNLGRIIANTTKVLTQWLDRYDIPYDEIHLGKPWAGKLGFYVDDRAIRPDEFVKLSFSEITELLGGPHERSDA
jgi:capsule biosynthesis phosphatase